MINLGEAPSYERGTLQVGDYSLAGFGKGRPGPDKGFTGNKQSNRFKG